MYFFQCFVRVDKTIVYSTDNQESTVSDLKIFVYDKFGIDPSKQVLKYLGKTLKDNTILKNSVKQDSTIHIYPRIINDDSSETVEKQNVSNSNN